MLVKKKIPFVTIICLLLLIILTTPTLAEKWWRDYETGLQCIKSGAYQKAIKWFDKALEKRPRDTKRLDYFPHREKAFCLLKLGRLRLALKELEISLQQAPSKRGRILLNKIHKRLKEERKRSQGRPRLERHPGKEIVSGSDSRVQAPTQPEPPRTSIFGDKLSVAVLQFKTKEEEGDLARGVIEKLTASLVEQGRFKVMERAELDRILDEQKLALSGILDEDTAAQTGKGIGVDAVLLGSVLQVGIKADVNARLIDTETASIITAKSVVVKNWKNPKLLSDAMNELAYLLSSDIPILEGIVVQVEKEAVYIDLGTQDGLKKGMKCMIYREGEEMTHPVTGEDLGKKIEDVAQVCIVSVGKRLSKGFLIKKRLDVEVGDKVVTR
jgi:TolB-like protein